MLQLDAKRHSHPGAPLPSSYAFRKKRRDQPLISACAQLGARNFTYPVDALISGTETSATRAPATKRRLATSGPKASLLWGFLYLICPEHRLAASRDAPDAHSSGVIQCPVTCHLRTGCEDKGGITHAPVGPKSQPTKLAGSLICAVVRPFDSGNCGPVPALAVRVVVCLSQ